MVTVIIGMLDVMGTSLQMAKKKVCTSSCRHSCDCNEEKNVEVITLGLLNKNLLVLLRTW